MKNITISADEKLVRRARELARRQGTSLNALIRGFLETLVGPHEGAAPGDELLRLMREQPGRSRARRITREDAYRGRL